MSGVGLVIGVVGLIFYLFAILLPVALLVALQVWLCKKSVKLGLILPGISLAVSLLLTALIAINLIGAGPRNLIAMAVIFLVANIPTVVFGGIWLHFKGRQDTMDDLKRIKIEDLESKDAPPGREARPFIAFRAGGRGP